MSVTNGQRHSADTARPGDRISPPCRQGNTGSAEREIEAVVAAGDESRDAADATSPGTEPMPPAADIQRLVAALSVQRTATGGLVIEAPPEAASTLAALFSGMAQLLQAAAAPPIAKGGAVERR